MTSKLLCSILAGCLILAFADQPHAQPTRGMRTVKTRELVRVEHSTYQVSQADNPVGDEKVTIRTYDDNTVVYESVMTLHQIPGTGMTQETELVLEEDSYFPRTFHLLRTIEQGEKTVQNSIDLDMVANVAVMRTKLYDHVDTSRVVVPAGTAIVDFSFAHQLYQFLYWYDNEAGGRQNFHLLNLTKHNDEPVVLYLAQQEPLTVNGTEYHTDLYRVESNNPGEVNLNVDQNGRILRYQRGLLVYELVDWSQDDVNPGGSE